MRRILSKPAKSLGNPVASSVPHRNDGDRGGGAHEALNGSFCRQMGQESKMTWSENRIRQASRDGNQLLNARVQRAPPASHRNKSRGGIGSES